MRKLCLLAALIGFYLNASGQVPVNMASQPSLTYIANFDSIATWTNNFSSGYGAGYFSSVPVGGTATIPNAAKITTSSAAFVSGSTGGIYRDTANDRIAMLVTGTTDNSSSVAIDLNLNFTSLNAGSLSFDWTSVFNGAGTSNRTGTLKVYASIDGISFTELPGAEVTVTNYVAGTGSITNVQWPPFVSNSATARLRFYYFNSAGGSSGSRPKIALDNIKVVASGNPCATPTSSPSGLTFTNVTPTSITGNFNAPTPAPDEYLVVATVNGSLSSYPVDSYNYNTGDLLGDGIVVYRGIGNSFATNGLAPLTTYTFYVFPLNIYCNGATKYRVSNILSAVVTTPAGPPCAPPSAQPGNLIFSSVTTSSIQGSFTPVTGASEYLVVASTSSSLSSTPTDGMNYNPGDPLGGGNVIFRGATSSFVATGLNHSTNYYFFVYSLNNYACSNGPAYLAANPLTGQQATNVILPCTTPVGNASSLILNPGNDYISGFFTPYNSSNDGYLVVMSTSSTLSALPQDGVTYTKGTSLGGGTVLSTDNNYNFIVQNLLPTTAYYFYIFSYNSICIGAPLYKTSSYLTGNTSTTFAPKYNYYFGNLHSHSSYSDGNRDSSSLTPADDYAYAKDALCMDFLGISDHNHYTAAGNPGMLLSNYQPGITEAANFTAANPGFLALYGMEWGVQNNGGHVLIYGVNQLIGWDTVGGNPNYNIYVPKNDYLSSNGLFRKINSFSGVNAFATLAHPAWSDFQFLAYNSVNKRADSAITGIAVESGPAFSSDTSYNNAGSNMSFLPYYEQMLGKGYHVAPMIDHDNHNTTFGKTAGTRTAVLATSLTETDFLHAMKNRRFYATQDCDARADLQIYGHPMGSIMSHSFAPSITLRVEDPTNVSAVPMIKLMYGVPGRGIPPIVLSSAVGNNLSYTDHTLSPDSTAYYYGDIMMDGKRIITAPIWYTRRDTTIVNNVQTIITGNSIRIKNNPAGRDLNVEVDLNKSSGLQMRVYSSEGRVVYNQIFQISKGEQTIALPLENLTEGIYILEVVIGQERVIRKFTHL